MCQPDGFYGPLTDREVAVRRTRCHLPLNGGSACCEAAARTVGWLLSAHSLSCCNTPCWPYNYYNLLDSG